MKRTIWFFLSLASVTPFVTRSQSTMEFQSGTNIEVTSGADICADNVIIDGTYSGSGTVCITGSLPVELATMSASATARDVTIIWKTATETENYGFEIQRRMVTSYALQVTNVQPEPRNAELETQWSQIGFVHGSGTSSSTKEYTFSDQKLAPGRYAYRIRQVDQDGSFAYTGAVEVEVGLAPKEFTLSQNYPNPFNPTTTIEFTLPEDGHVGLKVYDVAGTEVANLLDEERRAGIYHQLLFNASRLGSGTYFVRINSGGSQISKKMLLVK